MISSRFHAILCNSFDEESTQFQMGRDTRLQQSQCLQRHSHLPQDDEQQRAPQAGGSSGRQQLCSSVHVVMSAALQRQAVLRTLPLVQLKQPQLFMSLVQRRQQA